MSSSRISYSVLGQLRYGLLSSTLAKARCWSHVIYNRELPSGRASGWRIDKVTTWNGWRLLVKAASKSHFSGMRHLLLILLHLVRSLGKLLKPNAAKALVAENCLLKHQLLIARRSRRRAPNLRFSDRLLFGLGSLFLPPRRLLRTAILIKPSTLLRCHRALARLKLKWLYSFGHRHKPGPKGPGQDLIQAIIELKRRNPHVGCRKIAQQLAKSFGIELDKDVVRRVLAPHYPSEVRDHGPSWLALLGHAKDSLWSVDLFRAESLLLKSHWVLVVMDVFTRRIIGFGVQPVVVDGPALCRMFNRIIAGQAMPKRLSYDHDPLFEFQRWQANLRILGIQSVRSVPYSPVHRETDRDGPSRIFGPPVFLERG